MKRHVPESARGLSAWLAAAVCVSAAALVWIGYRAVVEWQHAAALVASRRAEAAADALVTALTRDMRGAQALVLSSADRDGLTVAADVDLLHPIGSAFARYPYPEAFFSWREAPTPTSVVFYSRADRHPSWITADEDRRLFPVVVGREPSVARRLLDRVTRDVAQGRRFSIFDLDLAGTTYQVVTVVSYLDSRRERPAAVTGFMVNLDWARRHYFSELAAQVADVEGNGAGIRFQILDEHGNGVVAGPSSPGAPAGRRAFPMAFFDPLVVAVDRPPDLHLGSWTAVATADDPTLVAAERGARRTLGIATVMALVLTVGLVLTLRAARESAKLAEMRSEFVSAVTHELKTPIANLRAINETLVSDRSTIEMSREYAQMGIREARRLTRLIDNLLAYARITDVADAYSFEPVAVDAIVDRSLREFAPNLSDQGFEVDVDLPDGLPSVHGDPTALGLMLNNVIDNAIRYSKERRHLTIKGRHEGDRVVLEVTDCGVGIPAAELPRVTRKFFRGRGSKDGGSGLGLAIVDRIVTDHAGSLDIRSTVGVGTTVTIALPVAR